MRLPSDGIKSQKREIENDGKKADEDEAGRGSTMHFPSGKSDGWVDGWMDGWMDEWMKEWVDGWMNGRVDGWMDGCMDEWVDTG